MSHPDPDAEPEVQAESETETTLPPLLDIRDALDRIERHADADVGDQVDLLRDRIEALEGASGAARSSAVDDLDNRIHVISEQLPPESEAQRWIDSILNRLERYRDTRDEPSDTLYLSSPKLMLEGRQTAVRAAQTETARFRTTIVNQGERSGAVVKVTFYHADGITVREVQLPAGYVDAGGKKTLDTRVYVPSIAASYEAVAVDPSEGQRFLPNL